MAVKSRRPDLARLLLECGARVNAMEQSKNYTPLYYAVLNRDHAMTETLLQEGALVHNNRWAFERAIYSGDDWMLELLLRYVFDGDEEYTHYTHDLHYYAGLKAILIGHLSRGRLRLGDDGYETDCKMLLICRTNVLLRFLYIKSVNI